MEGGLQTFKEYDDMEVQIIYPSNAGISTIKKIKYKQ